MSDNLISVLDLADRHGKRKQTIFKILSRLSIETTKRLGDKNRGQLISYVTEDEARMVETELLSGAKPRQETEDLISDILLTEKGVFYLLALEPETDPGRFKVGFATTLPERLRHLRCSAPFLQVIATWPCRRLWEKTAIECVSEGCARLHTEVFRTDSIASVREKSERFFALMPSLLKTEEKSPTMPSSESSETLDR